MKKLDFTILGIATFFVVLIGAPQVNANIEYPTGPSVSSSSDLNIPNNDFNIAAVDLDLNYGANEPHIAVNPLDNTNVIAANFGGGLQISTDSGASFPTTTTRPIPPSLAGLGYTNGGDDVVTFDSQGRLFWTYLLGLRDAQGNRVDLTVVVAQVNPTTGAIIGNAIDITPGNFSDDKPWIAADANPLSPNADNLYITWSRLDLNNDGPTGLEDLVLFSRSIDSNTSWSAPQSVSLAAEWFSWPPHVAVAPNGDVYVNYPTNSCSGNGLGSTIQVLRDTTGGLDMASGNPVQKSTGFGPGGADITCNVQGFAGTIPQSISWMQGSQAAYTLADPLVAGKIYLIGNDDPNDDFTTGDSADVVMTISLDNGNTWGAPTTISTDNTGAFQVMPTGAIDQFGNIGVTWYDSRSGNTNAGGNLMLDLYGTFSTDGGATFGPEFIVSDTQFDPDLNAPVRFNPPPTLRIGEYNGITASNCLAYTVWTGNNAAFPNSQEIFFDTFPIPGPGCIGDINGFKYEDIDADGSFNNSDVPIQGWEICLFNAGDDPEVDPAIDCKDTDSNGEVTFEDIEFGDYQACEEVQDGWTNISDVCQDVSIDPENQEDTAEFGNFENGTVTAIKYNDLDVDGAFNNDDEVIEDWEICIFESGDEPDPADAIECQDTDGNGEVLFEDLGPGDYVICEEDQAEWVHTTDDCFEVTIDVSGENEDGEFGNVRPIEAEKSWTHTDYNWGLICDEPNPEPPYDCLVDERPREIDIPTDEVLSDPLPILGDKYILEATTNKDKVKNVTPGAFYALTTIEINIDVDSLTVDEIYNDCYADQELIQFVSKKPTRNVKVAVADPDGVVTELSDYIYDDIGGTIDEIDDSHAKIIITDTNNLQAGNTLFVLVKFQDDLKNASAPGNVYDEMCDNVEDVTAELLNQDAEILAEAALRITSNP